MSRGMLAACLFAVFVLWPATTGLIGYRFGAVAGEAALAGAKAANEDAMSALARLKSSVADCEAGRIADRAAQAQALVERDAVEARLNAAYDQQRAALRARMQNECAQWAKQPACGSGL